MKEVISVPPTGCVDGNQKNSILILGKEMASGILPTAPTRLMAKRPRNGSILPQLLLVGTGDASGLCCAYPSILSIRVDGCFALCLWVWVFSMCFGFGEVTGGDQRVVTESDFAELADYELPRLLSIESR